MAINLFRKRSQKNFEWFIGTVFSQYEAMLSSASNDFMDLYKTNELVNADSVKTILPEIIQYLIFVIYLNLQQYWQPFREPEARVVNEYIEMTNSSIRNSVLPKYNMKNILGRINDYDMVARKQVGFYGQSLYLALDDEQLSNLKSDAYGRCAILFTDFLYFSRILNDFASLEDMSSVLVTGFELSVIDNFASVKTMEIAFKIIRNVQATIASIKR